MIKKKKRKPESNARVKLTIQKRDTSKKKTLVGDEIKKKLSKQTISMTSPKFEIC